jgi:hypothetical protein
MASRLRRLKELTPDWVVSPADVAHGRHHDVPSPRKLQGRQLSEPAAGAGHHDNFSAHRSCLSIRGSVAD